MAAKLPQKNSSQCLASLFPAGLARDGPGVSLAKTDESE